MDEILIGTHRIRVMQGDITLTPADAILNAANSSLVGGGGVDGAIHRAGGPAIMADLERRYGADRHCPTGSAVLSYAGDLTAFWVIHAVGPVWRGGGNDEAALLASAYRTSFYLAEEAGAHAVAAPAISAGIYGYPLEAAAEIAVTTAARYLAGPTTLERIDFVLFSKETLAAFERALARAAEGIGAASSSFG